MPEKEVDIKIDKEEKEVELEKNPLEKLQEETKAEPVTEEPVKEEVIKEEKKVEAPKKEVPAYSDDLPYSEKVRKRIAKEVGKRSDAERKALEWEEKYNTLEGKARSGLKTGFKNNYENVSKLLKKYKPEMIDPRFDTQTILGWYKLLKIERHESPVV